MTHERILLADDDAMILDVLRYQLEKEGYQVLTAEDGQQALDLAQTGQPDLVLLDVMLPTVSGLDVCREIRQRSEVPIIMVTARASEIDTVVGLEVGADDYVTKPYRLRELVARMRAVLRRQPRNGADPIPESADVIVIDGIELDLDRHEVQVRGEQVSLPLKEFELLAVLMENAGRVLPRSTLIDRVWGSDYVGDTKTLDVHVKRLRSKVEPDPSHPTHITTIRGLGYKFSAPRN